ncbi:MAG: 30S ribosomal protein S6 [Candidatus Parcubacteria bacterium]|nr:30S ribosomal protein S6 [Candidatus Parcubacteria bacterium]
MTEEQQDEQLSPRLEHYELLYIVPMSYTAEELKPIVEKVASLIKENNGTITRDDNLGKQKLAYIIKTFSHGYYLLYEFDLPKANLLKLNRALTLDNEIIRFIITKKKIKTAEEINQEKTLQEKLAKKKEKEIEKIKAEKEEVKEKPKKETGKVKISLEDLDKKLDEILDTDKL